nr:hypothetical protein Iba_chr12bCG0270 [Ipomoea batatas]
MAINVSPQVFREVRNNRFFINTPCFLPSIFFISSYSLLQITGKPKTGHPLIYSSPFHSHLFYFHRQGTQGLQIFLHIANKQRKQNQSNDGDKNGEKDFTLKVAGFQILPKRTGTSKPPPEAVEKFRPEVSLLHHVRFESMKKYSKIKVLRL